MFTPFVDVGAEPAIRGFLHEPQRPSGDAAVLSHGAGADCQSKLLVEMSEALAAAGFTVLRLDLPFRQLRPHGPPPPGSAARDQDGLRRAVEAMRERGVMKEKRLMKEDGVNPPLHRRTRGGREEEKIAGRIFLGGHSYGGRQATLLVAEEAGLVDGLLLLSYPLHPPKKPTELRTRHFPKLSRPAFFVHGTRDGFGTIAEMKAALELIPAPHNLFEVDGAGHDLLGKKTGGELPALIAKEFQEFMKGNAGH
jgi:hypothetical protein